MICFLSFSDVMEVNCFNNVDLFVHLATLMSYDCRSQYIHQCAVRLVWFVKYNIRVCVYINLFLRFIFLCEYLWKQVWNFLKLLAFVPVFIVEECCTFVNIINKRF